MPPVHDEYAAQLYSLTRGHAIYHPHPGWNHGRRARNPPVRIGDVGYMFMGGFQRLFNVHLERGHPEQATDAELPDNFELLPFQQSQIFQTSLSPQVFCSRSVRTTTVSLEASAATFGGGKIEFSAAQERGAVLATPDAIRSSDARNRRAYEQHMLAHIEDWHALTERQGLGVKLEDLALVMGVDLTQSWSTAVWTDRQLAGAFALEVDYAVAGNVRLASQFRWRNTQSAQVNWGPQPDRFEENIPGAVAPKPVAGDVTQKPVNELEDQVVFIRRLRAKKRPFLGIKLQANADPLDLDDPDPDDECGEELVIESDYDQPEDFDALTPILDHILEHSGASIAIVHDDDLQPFSWMVQNDNGADDYRARHLSLESGPGGAMAGRFFVPWDLRQSKRNKKTEKKRRNLVNRKMRRLSEPIGPVISRPTGRTTVVSSDNVVPEQRIASGEVTKADPVNDMTATAPGERALDRSPQPVSDTDVRSTSPLPAPATTLADDTQNASGSNVGVSDEQPSDQTLHLPSKKNLKNRRNAANKKARAQDPHSVRDASSPRSVDVAKWLPTTPAVLVPEPESAARDDREEPFVHPRAGWWKELSTKSTAHPEPTMLTCPSCGSQTSLADTGVPKSKLKPARSYLCDSCSPKEPAAAPTTAKSATQCLYGLTHPRGPDAPSACHNPANTTASGSASASKFCSEQCRKMYARTINGDRIKFSKANDSRRRIAGAQDAQKRGMREMAKVSGRMDGTVVAGLGAGATNDGWVEPGRQRRSWRRARAA